nr:MAG TPA: hypothetical protein [Caudoviricetes sp.]
MFCITLASESFDFHVYMFIFQDSDSIIPQFFPIIL